MPVPSTAKIGPNLATAPKRVRDRAPGRAARYRALAVRYAILADYVLGEKVEAIAARHSVSHRMVSYIAAQHVIEHPLPRRPRGRPKGSTKELAA